MNSTNTTDTSSPNILDDFKNIDDFLIFIIIILGILLMFNCYVAVLKCIMTPRTLY